MAARDGVADSELLQRWRDSSLDERATWPEGERARAIELARKEAPWVDASLERMRRKDRDDELRKSEAVQVFSEDGAALAFVDRHAEDIRFDATAGEWHVWEGHRWQRDARGEVLQRMRGLVRELGQTSVAKQRAAFMQGALRLAAGDPRIVLEASSFDRDPDLLATPVGVVDLRNGHLRDGQREDHITRSASVAPAEWGAEPARWLAFLDEALDADVDVIAFLQRLAGYVLTGHTREQKFLCLVGRGGTGTSTFCNALVDVLGSYACMTASETFSSAVGDRHPADLAALDGARLVICPEVERGRHWAESRLKTFTGEGKVNARFMRGNPFEYEPLAKLVITGNALPGLSRVDEAVRRRMLVVEFNVKPVAPDMRLRERLRGEGPEILRWAIEGALEWQAEGLRPPAQVRNWADAYLDQEDTFRLWRDEHCLTGDPEGKEATADLFASWRQFCQVRNEFVGSMKGFAQVLRQEGYRPLKVADERGRRGFAGLRLKDGPPMEGGSGGSAR